MSRLVACGALIVLGALVVYIYEPATVLGLGLQASGLWYSDVGVC